MYILSEIPLFNADSVCLYCLPSSFLEMQQHYWGVKQDKIDFSNKNVVVLSKI